MMNDYFEWMYASVCTDPEGNYIPDYHELLLYLHSRDFEYTLPMDGNREADGINLRYHYGWETGKSNAEVASEIDVYPCSVLEVMVALCRRIESDVMGDYNYGNRTSVWFFSMLNSLGISEMTDDSIDNIDKLYLEEAIDRCLNREYDYDGKGGFFTCTNPYCDMRTVEIWNQAMWFLNEYVEN